MAVLSHYGDAEEPNSCDPLYIYVIPDNEPLTFSEIKIRGGHEKALDFQPTNNNVNFTIPNCNGESFFGGGGGVAWD